MQRQPSQSEEASEASDEEESTWKWCELSPVALTAALPEGVPPRELCTRLRWIRLFWWLALLVFYASVLLLASTDRELSSALRQEAVEELFPDWNKAAERMKEGMKTPELKELLHVDDVASTLTIFNDRCRDQSFVSTSMKAVWECKLFDVVVNRLSGAEWDPAMNRNLPDIDSDNVFGTGKKGIFETKVNEASKELANERRRAMQTICSDIFFQNHVVIGDDPKKVPWGNVTAFDEEVVNKATAGSGLHPDFDFFPNRGHGQTAITQRLVQLHKDAQETQKGMDKITRALHLDPDPPDEHEPQDDPPPLQGHGSPRLHRRNPWLLDVEAQPEPGSPPLGLLAVATRPGGSSSRKEPGVQWNESQRQEEREKVDEDDKYYGPGCFDTSDVAGLLRDLWSRHIGQGSTSMGKPSAEAMLKEVMPNVTGDSLERLWQSINHDDHADGNQSLSAKEFLDFAESHLSELQFPVRGYLNLECRNHHFSLIGLCKPEYISVLYQIGFVPSSPGHKSERGRCGTRMHIRMIFKQLETGAGWYKADLRITVKSQVGAASTTMIVMMFITLTLCLLLTLFDTTLTLILLLLNLLRVLQLDLPSTSYEEIEHLLWLKVLYIVDARGVLSRTSQSVVIVIERLIGICFVAACVQAAREALMPNSMPMGGMSDRCVLAWLQANKEWIINSLRGVYVEHGLSILTYLHECTNLNGIDYAGELVFQLLFEEEGSYHALVVGLVFVRVLESFNLTYRLRWLPRTIFLAKFKLINFVIAYVALVAGFALLMTLYFGELYQQYSTLDRSFHTLLVYSFGMTERATYGMQPFIERSGGHLYAALFVFSVFMVTIILNMFTTIVIDAFAAEGDPEKFSRMYQEEVKGLTHSLLRFFGKGHVVARSLRKTHRASASGSCPGDHPVDQGPGPSRPLADVAKEEREE